MDCSTSLSSSQSINIRHVRSVSLPTQSHPSVLEFEEELTNLKKWEANYISSFSTPTFDTIYGALTRLERLYTCTNDLIGLPQTKQAFSHEKHQKLFDELLDRSMMLLDVCGSLRDAMEQIKQYLRDVQSALRRRKGDMIVSIDTSFFKKIKKDTKKTLSSLKQFNNKVGVLNLDHQLSCVVRLLRDTSLVSISVFGLLLSLTSSVLVSKPKATRWSLVSNLIQKVTNECVNHPPVSSEVLESHMEVIERSLECMFRSLIKSRASLLKNLSY